MATTQELPVQERVEPDEAPAASQPAHPQTGESDDPMMDMVVLAILVIFLIAVLFVPQEWFLQASMWWNGVK